MSKALEILGWTVSISSGCFWILICSVQCPLGGDHHREQLVSVSCAYRIHFLCGASFGTGVMWEKLWDMPVYLICNMRRWGLTCFWWPFIWIYSQTYRIGTNMEWETSIYILPSLQLFTFFPICFSILYVYIHVNYVLNQLRVSWRHHTPLSLNAMYIFWAMLCGLWDDLSSLTRDWLNLGRSGESAES